MGARVPAAFPVGLLCVLLTLLLAACSDNNDRPEDTFLASQVAYLDHATAQPLRPGSLLNVLNHLERASRDDTFNVADGAVPADAWDPVFEKLFRLRDTSDFDLLYLMNLVYAFSGHPVAPQSLWDAADEAMLNFKYWYTDPTPEREFAGEPVIDSMWYWTENHVLIFRVNEYLAGQRHPDTIFSVTGMTGAWHRERAREAIFEWLDERARYGFTEWHSDVYYQKDITPLLSLVEWAEDEELANRAAMVLDLVLLDIALHVHRGNFGATHGRSYVKDKASATTQDAFNGTKLLFADTALDYTSTSAPDASLLSRATQYRMPAVLAEIARDDAPMIDRERMNLPLDEVPDPDPSVYPQAPPGLDWFDEANLPFWWSMGAQTLWMMVPLTLEVGERENLWQAQFAPYKPLRDIVWVEGDFEATLTAARPLLRQLWPAVNLALLKEVNTYTYRTKDYMLSTAQDYRKGVRGAQTHIAQATLDEHAIVFTQHPGYLPVAAGEPVPPDWNWQREDEPGPGYWSGSASEPRSAQYENVVIQLYAPQYGELPALGFSYRDETHAYFPHAHFDEVTESGNWTFGRKGEAYVALYSMRPTVWRTGQPEVFQNGGLPFDLVAEGGAENVWIIECGSATESGSFAEFQSAINAAPVTTTPVADRDGDGFADGYAVEYDSPGVGAMRFDWHGPLLVNGEEIEIRDYPRFSNPFIQTEFGETRYDVRHGGKTLLLDYETGERRVSN